MKYITGHLGRALSGSALGFNGEMSHCWDQCLVDSTLMTALNGPIVGICKQVTHNWGQFSPAYTESMLRLGHQQ